MAVTHACWNLYSHNLGDNLQLERLAGPERTGLLNRTSHCHTSSAQNQKQDFIHADSKPNKELQHALRNCTNRRSNEQQTKFKDKKQAQQGDVSSQHHHIDSDELTTIPPGAPAAATSLMSMSVHSRNLISTPVALAVNAPLPDMWGNATCTSNQ